MLLAIVFAAFPTSGFYYRQAFADSVADGSFDPDAYVTAIEPCVQVNRGKVIVHYGQESQAQTKADVVVVDGAHIRTALLSETAERLVRLAPFEALARQTRARRTLAQRQALAGTYQAANAKPVTLTPDNFELYKCLPGCESDKATWCVKQGRALYRVVDASLVEVDAPRALCPDGRAVEPRASARTFKK